MVAIGADEKKKLFILGGLAGLLILVVLFVIKPFGGGSSDDAAAPVDTTAAAPPITDAQPVSTEGAALPAAPAPVAMAGGSATTIGIVNPRSDPFAPKVVKALPPPPPPPYEPPVSLPSPDASRALPLRPLPPGLSQTLNQPLGLPPTRIPQYTPRQAPRALTGATIVGSASSGAQSAVDKRLAGVAIGDSVRALLEINDGVQTITRVVQPGDEVEGIRILRIERVTEGGNTVTRMFISQNGQEQFVDLRPSSTPIAGVGGPEGMQPGFVP